jgi:hypothetical protein
METIMKTSAKNESAKRDYVSGQFSAVRACPSSVDEKASSVTFHNPAPYASPSITGGESEVFVVKCED